MKGFSWDWISMRDTAPAAGQSGYSERVLVTVEIDGKRSVAIDRYNGHAHTWDMHGEFVTHWQHLPLPALRSSFT